MAPRERRPMSEGFALLNAAAAKALKEAEKQKAKARECPGWKGIINRCYPDSVYAAGGAREAHRWEDLGAEAQQLCWAKWREQGGTAA